MSLPFRGVTVVTQDESNVLTNEYPSRPAKKGRHGPRDAETMTSTPRVKRHQRMRKLGWVCLPNNIRVRPEVVEAVLDNAGLPPGSYDRATVRAAFELDFARLVR